MELGLELGLGLGLELACAAASLAAESSPPQDAVLSALSSLAHFPRHCWGHWHPPFPGCALPPSGPLPHPIHPLQEREAEALLEFDDRMAWWFRYMTHESLDISLCLDTRGGVAGTDFIVQVSGTAEEGAVRETSPLVMTNDLDLVPLGKAMRGDPPDPSRHHQQQRQQRRQ